MSDRVGAGACMSTSGASVNASTGARPRSGAVRQGIGAVRHALVQEGLARQSRLYRQHGRHEPDPHAPLVLVACSGAGYSYAVPEALAHNARVIFTDGAGRQVPGSGQPGMAYDGGIARWQGSGQDLSSCTVPVTPPQFSISGEGVSHGRMTLDRGQRIRLRVSGLPSDATATWWSDGASAAVTGHGYVVGAAAGTCRIHVEAGGKTASVSVTVR